jgi:hypothetical protein
MAKPVQTVNSSSYWWLYTTMNDNSYLLFLVIIFLVLIIVNFKLYKTKKDRFYNITIPSTTISSNMNSSNGSDLFDDNNDSISTNEIIDNPRDKLFVTTEEKETWARAWSHLDGNQETVLNSSYTSNINSNMTQNDILQLNSTLYNISSSSNVNAVNYNSSQNWATIDNLGSTLTDTLGGIRSQHGYTLLNEQLGTFNPNYNNPNLYDNTKNYNTSVNTISLNGVTSSAGSPYGLQTQSGFTKVGTPLIMQKDFAGVANIFAPNIYVVTSDKALHDDAFPNISYSV